MHARPRRRAPITRQERAAARPLHAQTMAAVLDEARDVRVVADALRRIIEGLTYPADARP